MNNQSKIIISLITAVSLVGLNTSIQKNLVLANSEPTAPIDDGARYLRGLEPNSSDSWDFRLEEDSQKQTNYQLRIYEPDVRLVEPKEQKWGNTGEQPNRSVLVDIYDFTEEETE